MQTIRIETPGPSMHEVDIFRMHEGATVADLRHWLTQEDAGQIPYLPNPADAMGGAGDNHDIRHVTWLQRTFNPGRYVLICEMPMPSTGAADAPKANHADVGMVREIEVAP
jgi:hypothetical protein